MSAPVAAETDAASSKMRYLAFAGNHAESAPLELTNLVGIAPSWETEEGVGSPERRDPG